MDNHEAASPRSGASERSSASLDARLRALRAQHTNLSVLTEIVHLSDRLVAIRATVSIDGQTRAHGHAAQAADQSGAFVAEAELLAVRQALLLGGFGAGAEASPTISGDSARPPVSTTAQREAASQPQIPPDLPTAAPRAQRQRATEGAARHTITPQSPDDGTEAVPVPTLFDLPTRARAAEGAGAVADERVTPASGSLSVATGADAVPATTLPPAGRAPVPRPKRDRSAERARARARVAVTTPLGAGVAGEEGAGAVQSVSTTPADGTDPAVGTAVPGMPVVSVVIQGQAAAADDAVPTPATLPPVQRIVPPPQRAADDVVPPPPLAPPARSTTTRHPRASASTTPAATPAPAAPPTQEQLRVAWTRGHPIPAWWPPERPLVTKRVTKAQMERLRAVALDEEITPALLDTYSTMLFERPVAELDQTEYAILEERLDRTYPSPLEETRARRLLYPIAVGDAMLIPPDHSIFIRWRDVPPVVEEEPRQPTTPSWRTRGTRAGGRRR